MVSKEYPRIGEKIYHAELPNGLHIYVDRRPEFQKSYAFFATNYGGMDMKFHLDGQWRDTPAGVAHFMEHKIIVPFYLILFVYSHFPEGAAPWAALLSGSFYSSSRMPSPSSPLSFSSAAGVSSRVWWMGSSLSPSRAIMFSSTVISVEISSA